jgi:SAM-dependent methyltransferase
MDFYEGLSATYDRMTRFESRLDREKTILRTWVDRYGLGSVLDAACGTGLHVIALRKLGITAIGTDISAPMIQKALENAKANSVDAEFVMAGMTDLRDAVETEFDAVFCLGNSIPHLLSNRDLIGAFESFAGILKPGGLLLLQLLNYERILASRNRIVGNHSDGNLEFVRFYDFHDPLIRFNILVIDHSSKPNSHRLHSTELYPYTCKELTDALSDMSFTDVEIFGSMNRDEFDPSESTDLVISARRE